MRGRERVAQSIDWHDFVARAGEWVSVHPGITLLDEHEDPRAVVHPMVGPPLMLELFRPPDEVEGYLQ